MQKLVYEEKGRDGGAGIEMVLVMDWCGSGSVIGAEHAGGGGCSDRAAEGMWAETDGRPQLAFP